MRAILLVATLSTYFLSQAQTVDWVQQVPLDALGTDFVAHNSIAVNQYEEIALIGIADSLFTYGIQSYGNLKFNLIDSTGTLLHSTRYVGSGAVSDVEAFGDYFYVLGQFKDSLSFPGLPMLDHTMQAESRGSFIAKFHHSGSVLWVKDLDQFVGAGFNFAFDITASEELYIAGNSLSGVSGNSTIIKLDSSGSLISNWLLEGVGSLSSISVNATGQVAFAGSCLSDTIILNGTTTPAINDYNHGYGMFNSSGMLQWFHTVLDITCIFPSVHIDDSGNTFVSSDSYIDAALGTDSIYRGPWVYWFYVGKVLPSGTVDWVYQLEDNGVVSGDAERSFVAELTPCGTGVCISGRYRGTANWGNGIITTNTIPGQDFFLAELSGNGTVTNIITSGVSSFHKKNSAIARGNNGAYYMLTTNYGDFVLPGHTLPNTDRGLYLSRWVDGSTSIAPAAQSEAITLFPNPATENLRIAGLTQAANVQVIDALGKSVLQQTINHNEELDISALPAGTYHLRVRNQKSWLAGKTFVKE